MLTHNINVSDGLVSGARGEVNHIVRNNDRTVSSVLVNFDNLRVGIKTPTHSFPSETKTSLQYSLLG